MKESDKCTFCEETDDLFHFFYNCHESNAFWDSLNLWLGNNSLENPRLGNLEEIELLFGIRHTDDEDFRLNFIILLGKFFIYREKLFGYGRLDLYKFLMELKPEMPARV